MAAAAGSAGVGAAARELYPVSGADIFGSALVILHEVPRPTTDMLNSRNYHGPIHTARPKNNMNFSETGRIPRGAHESVFAGAAGAAAAGAAAAAAPKPPRPGKYVLIGKESKYCTDRYPKPDSPTRYCETLRNPFIPPVGGNLLHFTYDTFKEREKVVVPPSISEKDKLGFVLDKLSSRIQTIMGVNPGIRLRYEIPKPNGAKTEYTTKIRFLPEEFTFGIVKGGREKTEDKEYFIETPVNTVLREYEEEVGGKILNDLRGNLIETTTKTSNKYLIYIIQVRTGIRNAMEAKINERNQRYLGEVFDLQFMHTDDIKGIYHRLNRPSKDALKTMVPQAIPLGAYGGARKQKTKRDVRKHVRHMLCKHKQQRKQTQKRKPRV
jgi:hypothetical protein